MPRTRTYTDVGYIEVQWSKKGHLVSLISGELIPSGRTKPEYLETVHKFTERGDMGGLMRDLTRARKQAFEPSGGDAPIPVLDPSRIILSTKAKKARAARIEYIDL